MKRILRLISIVGAVTLILSMTACAAPQDASRARSEYIADHGATLAAQGYASEAELLQGIMPAEEIRVEEYLNYYTQNFPQPDEGPLGWHATLGSTHLPDTGGEAWLQIGLQAAEATEQDIRPLNITLVLDKSGSMADADKMSFLKQSLYFFLEELDPEDIIAIVVYDDQPSVLLPAGSVGDGHTVRAAIEQLRPGGATNLHGGLMLGYEETMKFYAPELNNRVILLTDGIANRGVIDPEQIAADSLSYNQQGVFLSTIGLGFEFNDELLSMLSEQGKGNYHFINDAEEMERVFRQEAAGLVQTVATDVWLTLQLTGEVQVQRVYGYPYDLKEDVMRVQFDDAGAESSQILMVKMVVPAGQGFDLTFAQATLEYTDVFAEIPVEQTEELTISYGAPTPYDPFVSPSVRRNVTILRMAESLQQVSYLCDERKYQEALDLVLEITSDVWQIATQEGDEQMQEDIEILENYEITLQKLVDVSSMPPPPEPEQYEPYDRGPMPCPTPLVTLGFVAIVATMKYGSLHRRLRL
ncbi:MAG: VWA domain-containing protein [Anaerolineales bacterium]|nr:VWA domain-containing protein [Anaerolineales bacterium]